MQEKKKKKKEKKDFRPGFISEIEKEIKSLMVIVDIITDYNCMNHFSGKLHTPWNTVKKINQYQQNKKITSNH